MKRDWFEILVCVVFVCKNWHWCRVFGLTGFRFYDNLKLLEKE